MRALRPLALLVAAVLLASGAAQAKGVEAQRGPALDFLADRLPEAGALAANIAEAAHANGLDLQAWPSVEAPASQAIAEPPDDATNISLLRPLRALALAHDERAATDGDLTQRVLARFGPAGFGDRRTNNDDAYAILALQAVGLPTDDSRMQSARDHLLAAQGDDGGWGWTLGAPSGTDLTGLVVEALTKSGGVPEGTASRALGFLATTRSDPGFAEMPGSTPNCESTVWGIRATDRLGGTSRDDDWWFLLGLQQPDGGFSHLPSVPSDPLCTSEAVALLGEAHAGDVEGPAMEGNGLTAPGPLLALAAVTLAAAFWIRRP